MRRRAFTLIEMLMAASLMLLCLSLLVTTLVPVLRYAVWGSSRAELLQAATLVSTRLQTDLLKTNFEGLYLPDVTNPEDFSIHGIYAVSDTGDPVWEPQIIVYDWEIATGSLMRKTWPPGTLADQSVPIAQDAPLKPSMSDLGIICGQVNGSEHTLVSGILTQFALTLTSGQNSNPLHLSMTFQLAVPGRATETYQHDQYITLRTGQ